jgi:hypothetical protein
MSTRRKTKDQEQLAEAENDRIVVAQAEDETAWEAPVRVRRTTPAAVTIPAELAARAAFLARVHRQASVEDWLTRIIRERVELEEAAFVGAKRDLVTRAGVS